MAERTEAGGKEEAQVRYGTNDMLPRSLCCTNGTIAQSSDPGLLKKYSTFESYTTLRATYPRIRTFYKEHYESSKLPGDLPLLVRSRKLS